MSFSYKPLDRSRNEIRLVRIHATTNRNANIHCSLIHVSLDDQPAYHALSYSWGSTQKMRPILLDEQEFPVTENLYEALREVRGWSKTVDLWIDQISLNQADVAERNQEVLRMLDIYRNAVHVIVWLGTASDCTPFAIECLKKLSFSQKVHDSKGRADIFLRLLTWATYYAGLLFAIPLGTIVSLIQTRDFPAYIWIVTRTGLTGRLFRVVSGGRSLPIPLWSLFARPINLFMYYVFLRRARHIYVSYSQNYESSSRPTDAAINALRDLFIRDWFRRIWVVQEIIVAREATVLCGSYALDWEVVIQATRCMERQVWRSKTRHPYLNTDYEFAAIITTMHTRWRSEKNHERVDLVYLLSRFCYHKATIAHDKVYGLLGLSAEVQEHKESNISLQPRYDKPLDYAFADVVRYSIESSQRLDILRACTGHRKVPHLPSWVPDWTIAERKDSGLFAQWEDRYILPESQDSPRPVAEFSQDLKSLHVRGVIVGKVTNAGEDAVMVNSETMVMDNLPVETLAINPSNFNLAYVMPLFTLLGRLRVTHWLCKRAARHLAARRPGTILEDCEEVFDMLAIELEHMSNPTDSSFWEVMSKYWKTDVPLTMDVPRYAARMNEGERWKRQCTWEAAPELGLLPLLLMISDIEISAAVPQPGDAVCMMLGSSIPYILRGKDGFYELIGKGDIPLINRIVWKAAVKGYEAGNIKVQEFVIR